MINNFSKFIITSVIFFLSFYFLYMGKKLLTNYDYNAFSTKKIVKKEIIDLNINNKKSYIASAKNKINNNTEKNNKNTTKEIIIKVKENDTFIDIINPCKVDAIISISTPSLNWTIDSSKHRFASDKSCR